MYPIRFRCLPIAATVHLPRIPWHLAPTAFQLPSGVKASPPAPPASAFAPFKVTHLPLFPFETSATAVNSRTKRMDQASSLRQHRAFLEWGSEILGCQCRLGCLSLTFCDRSWNQGPALSYSIPENSHQPSPLPAINSQALSAGHWTQSRFRLSLGEFCLQTTALELCRDVFQARRGERDGNKHLLSAKSRRHHVS